MITGRSRPKTLRLHETNLCVYLAGGGGGEMAEARREPSGIGSGKIVGKSSGQIVLAWGDILFIQCGPAPPHSRRTCRELVRAGWSSSRDIFRCRSKNRQRPLNPECMWTKSGRSGGTVGTWRRARQVVARSALLRSDFKELLAEKNRPLNNLTKIGGCTKGWTGDCCCRAFTGDTV